MAENRQQATHARIFAHRLRGERAQRMAASRKLLEDRSGKVRAGAEAAPLRKSYREELEPENAPKANAAAEPKGTAELDRPRVEKGKSSLIDEILLILGIAVGAIAVASWIGGLVMDKGQNIAAQVEQEGGSNTTADDTVAAPPAAQSDSTELPAESPAPADLSWVWTGLGIAGGGAGVVLLSTLSTVAIKRSRRASLEYNEALAAKVEDRRQALAVWKNYQDTHQSLREKTLEIETDWDMIFKYPALMDGRVPTTRDFHRALKAANGASAEPPAELNLSMAIGDLHYPRLVTAAEESWDVAWAFAQRAGTGLIPQEERKKVDQIVQLLKLARDGGGSEHERAVAYERATKLMGELHFVKVPEAALRAISAEARPMIEASAELSSPAAQQVQPERLFAV